MSTSDSTPRKWSRLLPRFSLLTLLLAMAIVALAFTVFRQHAELRALRTELRTWRDDYGVLTVTDKSKIHAVQMRTDEQLSWKWRVWIPEGVTAGIAYHFGSVPRTGYPNDAMHLLGRLANTAVGLPSGEQTLRVEIRQDPVTNTWISKAEWEGGSNSHPIPPDTLWFLHDRFVALEAEGVGHATQVASADSRELVLMRYRSSLGGESSEASRKDLKKEGLHDGFMVWLEWK